jgi:hypothetical protein
LSCLGFVVLTIIVGFTWGGWVTGGTAKEMAETAAAEGRAELAAAICVERFWEAPDAQAQVAALKEESTWRQGDFIEDGGWVTLACMAEPVPEAGDLCAKRLVAMEAPAAKEAITVNDGATTVQ